MHFRPSNPIHRELFPVSWFRTRLPVDEIKGAVVILVDRIDASNNHATAQDDLDGCFDRVRLAVRIGTSFKGILQFLELVIGHHEIVVAGTEQFVAIDQGPLTKSGFNPRVEVRSARCCASRWSRHRAQQVASKALTIVGEPHNG